MHVGLIGFSENMKWPQHYTLNGETNIDGEVKNMKFHEKKPTVTWQVILPSLRHYIGKQITFLDTINEDIR